MTTYGPPDDLRAIEAIVERQFQSLTWVEGGGAAWEAFLGDFLDGASLYPAARPVRRQTAREFVERMQALSRRTLRAFAERLLGIEIRVFGNIAVAIAACEITENGSTVTRGVEALLLTKDAGAWRIASQAWDTERDDLSIPGFLVGRTAKP